MSLAMSRSVSGDLLLSTANQIAPITMKITKTGGRKLYG